MLAAKGSHGLGELVEGEERCHCGVFPGKQAVLVGEFVVRVSVIWRAFALWGGPSLEIVLQPSDVSEDEVLWGSIQWPTGVSVDIRVHIAVPCGNHGQHCEGHMEILF